MHIIIPLSDLQINPTAYRFEGGSMEILLPHSSWSIPNPVRVRRCIVIPMQKRFSFRRKVAFVVGSETVTVDEGNVVIVPAVTPHKFTNVSTTPLRMCGIHPTKEIIQTSLDE